MDNEYRSGQGSLIPTMFLGLGGTGSRIVDRIAWRASHLPNWESQLRPLTTFVSIDTNELDQHKLDHIPEGNRLNIAAFDKAKAIENFRRSKDQQALQWLDRGYKPRPGYKPGAGQIRLESRLGFFYHSPDIRLRLKELVDNSLRPGITWRQNTPPKFNIYVFCTLAGGTGSGCFLPTAYLVDAIIREQNWQPRVIGNLMLSTLLLDRVGPELHSDIHANSYAALKELEHMTKLDYQQVKTEGRTSEEFVYCRDENRRDVARVGTRPFFISFIFDRPPHLGLPEADLAIADAAYMQIFTPIIDNLASELDNYEKNLEDLTRFPGDLKNVGLGFTKNYGAFGAAAMVLPGNDLLEYCAFRFAAQAVRSQITFGTDSTDRGDDRARALAKLAVDYKSPRFLNMSDEGREKAINESFVLSVQEMARQDANQELFDGYWYQTVQHIDEGRQTGTDPDGKPIHGESLVDRVTRKLGEARSELFTKISIKERAHVYHREGVNQYIELVARLVEDIRAARQIVNEGVRGLESSASEGEVIQSLALDPIAERYLTIRLLDKCENQWIPATQQQVKKAQQRDIGNTPVRERLERELYESLQEAASKRRLFNRDQAFLDARDEAQEYYRSVASAAKRTLDAETQLRQLRALLDYLRRRSRQYAQLASRMNSLVQDLERSAERLRRGDDVILPALALRVEVFETLDEPRRRMWDGVYESLFLDGGRYLATFDRQLLASTITQELKPVIRPDGTVVEKGLDSTVADLRRALLELGRRRLAPAIFGDAGRNGLDLARGLELEAELILGPKKAPGETVSEDEIQSYCDKKFRALSQLAGIMARVNSAESKALDDGVKSNRTRQLIQGLDVDGSSSANRFLDRLRSILGEGGRQVKTDVWHDPRLLIVHDVELPIPLYYIEPVVGEVEQAYLKLAADERRSYHLHTAYQWEKSLPNLNPRKSEITVGWSLKVLAEGLLYRVVTRQQGSWVLRLSESHVEELGPNLATSLYRLGEIHNLETLPLKLEERLQQARSRAFDNDSETTPSHTALVEKLRAFLARMESRELKGELSNDDVLDRPIFRALIMILEDEHFERPGEASTTHERYAELDL